MSVASEGTTLPKPLLQRARTLSKRRTSGPGRRQMNNNLRPKGALSKIVCTFAINQNCCNYYRVNELPALLQLVLCLHVCHRLSSPAFFHLQLAGTRTRIAMA